MKDEELDFNIFDREELMDSFDQALSGFDLMDDDVFESALSYCLGVNKND